MEKEQRIPPKIFLFQILKLISGQTIKKSIIS